MKNIKIVKIIMGIIFSFVCFYTAIVYMDFNDVNATNQEVISPFALYEFEDSKNLGKDTSGNGFNLSTSGVNNHNVDGTDGYLSLSGKGGLYAQGLSGIKDFSDFITGSYTIRLIYRSSLKNGANYIITTGQYNKTFTVVNTSNIEIEVGNSETNPDSYGNDKIKFTQSTTNWIDLVIVGDASTNTAKVYVDGVLKESLDVSSGILLSQNPDTNAGGSSYSFCIGMQGNTVGGATAQRATADYKKVVVYNTALNAENVSSLYTDDVAYVPAGSPYIEKIDELDTNIYNFNINEKNTMEDISESLPEKISVTLSNGAKADVDVVWFGDTKTNSIKGMIMDDSQLNAKQLVYNVECMRKVEFKYDPNLISISDIKVDGVAYTLGDNILFDEYELTFKVSAVNEYILIESIKYYDVNWKVNDDGNVTVDVLTGGALIDITTSKQVYKVTYHDDDFVLGVSRYSYQGNETMYEYAKEGYDFLGWYSNESLKDEYKIDNLPYDNPTNLDLYAKFARSGAFIVEVVNDANKGSVSGVTNNTSYDSGSKLNISIEAKKGYAIDKVEWNDMAIDLSNNPTQLDLVLTVEKISTLNVSYIEIDKGGCSGTISAFNSVLSIVVLASALYIFHVTRKANKVGDEDERY